MKGIKKTICLLLSLMMILSMGVPVFAFDNATNEAQANTTSSEASPFSIEISTDKSSYSATGIAKITAKVTNTSGKDIKNASAEAVFGELAPCKKKSSQTTAEAETLKDGESLEFTYSATINKNAKKLNIFEKIILFFVRLFNGGYSAKDNGFDNGREFVESSSDIKFGKRWARNTIKVWFGESGETPDNPPTQDKSYEALIKDVDIDEIYEYDESDISIDETTGKEFINNVVLIIFEDDCTEKRKAEIINSINGKVVGGRKWANELHIKVDKCSFNELKKVCERLNATAGVIDADYDEVYYMEDESLSFIPNDTYIIDAQDDDSNAFNGLNLAWDNYNKFSTLQYSYRNWYHLAINMPGVWKYEQYLKNINIGVIDSGFKTNHEDLSIKVVSSGNVPGNHGTHVAGIIGATQNNGKGSTGILKNVSLYGYMGKRKLTSSEIYNGLDVLVRDYKCRIINLSQGQPAYEYDGKVYKKNNKLNKLTINEVDAWGKKASKEISLLLKDNQDFLIVQSAGNGAENTNLGIDSDNNGYFASITADNCYTKTKNVSIDDIMSRVIIVANAEHISNNNYQLTADSNGGSRTNIAAPGKYIYSTVAGVYETNNDGKVIVESGQKYKQLSGTSMAAPIVTGVAGLVWSVNPNFTGADVKKIVIDTAYDSGIMVKDNPDSPTVGAFPLVNAKFAVEEAMRRTYGEESVTNFAGGDGSEENPYQVATPAQLNAVRYHLDKHFIQIADIDLSGWGEWKPIGMAVPMYSTTGNSCKAKEELFTGTYNGNNYRIDNIKITDGDGAPEYDCYGLFAGTKDATLKNINVTNLNIDISKSGAGYPYIWKEEGMIYSVCAGGIAGICKKSNNGITVIDNCLVTGKIHISPCADAYVGGITGYGGTFTRCKNYADIDLYADSLTRYEYPSSTGHCGGITGEPNSVNGKIDMCTNFGNVFVAAGVFLYSGGISGKYGQISNSLNFGRIGGNLLHYGHSSTSFENCNVGGIVGATSSDFIKNCINYGEIYGIDVSTNNSKYSGSGYGVRVGGICGDLVYYNGRLISCYNLGKYITANQEHAVVGRIAGHCSNRSDCYSWEETFVNNRITTASSPTSDVSSSNVNGGNLTKEEMLKEETYKGFDFDNIWKIDSSVGGAVLK